jgi:hypothetical protein
MNADAKLEATLGREAGVALDHAVLHLDGAAHSVNHAAELDDGSIASSRASVRSSSVPASLL